MEIFFKTESLKRNSAQGFNSIEYMAFSVLEKFVCEWRSFEPL